MSGVTITRAQGTAGRPSAAGRRIPTAPLIVIPALSLLATAEMAASAFGVPLVPGAGWTAPVWAQPVWAAPVWAIALFVVAVVVSAAGRPRGFAHLAVEPFTMALMFVLAAVHGHSAGPAAQAGSLHAAHLGGSWLVAALALAVAALSAVCLACAARIAVTRPARTAILPVASAVAMCAMAIWMLVP